MVDLEEDTWERAPYVKYRVPCLVGPMAEDAHERLSHMNRASSLSLQDVTMPKHVEQFLYSALPLAINVNYENVLGESSSLGLFELDGRFLHQNPYLLVQDHTKVSLIEMCV